MVKVLSLFSGIGAFEMAIKNIGIDHEIVSFSEIDKHAIKSYCKIHNESPDKNLGDINKVEIEKIPYFDMMTYGFPCQDLSIAGKQKGLNGTRSGLVYTALKIIRERKPLYAIAENVKNLVGKNFKKDFEKLLEELESYGYKNYWKVLNAKDYGVPQNRERVFLISIREDINKDFKFPEPINSNIRLKDLLEKNVDSKYFIPQEKQEEVLKEINNNKKEKPNKLRLHRLGNVDGQNSQGKRVYDSNYIACTQTTTGWGYGATTGLYLIDGNVRKLTPKESWRVMGFDDKDFDKASNVSGERQLYRQAGNSIVVPILEKILNNLL